MSSQTEVFDESNAIRYPLIMTITHKRLRYHYRVAVGPFDARGSAFTYHSAIRRVRRIAEVFALVASVKQQWSS